MQNKPVRRNNEEAMTFVIAVNNRQVFEMNIANSHPIKNSKWHEIIVKEGFPCASMAYNEGLNEAKNEIVIFVHQDVYLPAEWDVRLLNAIQRIEKIGINWGVVGCYGVNSVNQRFGHLYSNGLNKFLGNEGHLTKVETLDEMLLVVRKSNGICFDINLPHFHLYGSDICLMAQEKKKECLAVSNFIIHNSLPVIRLSKDYWECVDYIRKKWRNKLPINTCVLKISKYDVGYHAGKFIRYIRDYKTAKSKGHIRRMDYKEIAELLRNVK